MLAVLSFFAAFFLIRYRLKEAKREEHKVEDGPKQDDTHKQNGVFSADPHLEPFGPFRRGQPPTRLLANCHTLCIWLSAVGFVLAIIGVLCFAWARLPRSVGIFASSCMGICLIGGVLAVVEASRQQGNSAMS